MRQLSNYIHDTTQFSWPTDASVQYITRLAHPWIPQNVGNSPLHGSYFPQFLTIRFYEDRGQVRTDPTQEVARNNLNSWLRTGTRLNTRATSMAYTVTTATSPFTIAQIERALGNRLGMDLPLLRYPDPHYAHVPRHLPLQEDNALQRYFHTAQDSYTYLLQLQYFIPGLRHLGPLPLHNGNRFIAYEDLDSDDDNVVHQIPPGNTFLRTQPLRAAPRPPLPVGHLPDPVQMQNWNWSNGRNDDDSDEEDQSYSWHSRHP